MSRVHARARTHAERAGDPLDGLVNLFDLGIVLAVAFLLAALSYLKLTGILSQRDVTVVQTTSGQTTIVEKTGAKVHVLHVTNQKVIGEGTRLGTVYRLSDGRLVYVAGH